MNKISAFGFIYNKIKTKKTTTSTSPSIPISTSSSTSSSILTSTSTSTSSSTTSISISTSSKTVVQSIFQSISNINIYIYFSALVNDKATTTDINSFNSNSLLAKIPNTDSFGKCRFNYPTHPSISRHSSKHSKALLHIIIGSIKFVFKIIVQSQSFFTKTKPWKLYQIHSWSI